MNGLPGRHLEPYSAATMPSAGRASPCLSQGRVSECPWRRRHVGPSADLSLVPAALALAKQFRQIDCLWMGLGHQSILKPAEAAVHFLQRAYFIFCTDQVGSTDLRLAPLAERPIMRIIGLLVQDAIQAVRRGEARIRETYRSPKMEEVRQLPRSEPSPRRKPGWGPKTNTRLVFAAGSGVRYSSSRDSAGQAGASGAPCAGLLNERTEA